MTIAHALPVGTFIPRSETPFIVLDGYEGRPVSICRYCTPLIGVTPLVCDSIKGTFCPECAPGRTEAVRQRTGICPACLYTCAYLPSGTAYCGTCQF